MKVLIIKLSPIEGLNSSMMRALALAKGFSNHGAEVDFLTVRPSKNQVLGISGKDYQNLNVIYTDSNRFYDGVVSKREKNSFKDLGYKILKKAYHKFSIFDYTKNIAKNVKIDILPKKQYDYVISISDPKATHIAAENLISQGLKYSNWIQYWGDPLTLDITRKSIYPNFIMKKYERRLFSNSNLIVYASPITLNLQKKLFPKQANKMIVIPTPYIEQKNYPKTNNSKIQVGYFGSYMEKVRDVTPLYESVKELSSEIELTIIGDSDTNLSETKNIFIKERQPIGNYESKTDLLVCILNKAGTQIPGKVFHYASTNKPILLILDGEFKKQIQKYFEQFDRYYMCENDIEAIKEKIKSIIKEKRKFEPEKAFYCDQVVYELLERL